MRYNRLDILREINTMLDELRNEGFISKEDIERREQILKNEEALLYFEFLFNRLLPLKAEQTMGEHPIEGLGLSARTYNAVARDRHIRTVEELASYTLHDLRSIRNLGEKGIAEIKEKLAKFKEEHALEE